MMNRSKVLGKQRKTNEKIFQKHKTKEVPKYPSYIAQESHLKGFHKPYPGYDD